MKGARGGRINEKEVREGGGDAGTHPGEAYFKSRDSM